MANPEIEIAWGGGSWQRGHRKVVRPVVSTVADLAVMTADEMGVTYNEPKKLHVWRCSRTWPEAGSNSSAVDMELYIQVSHIKHRTVARKAIEYYLTTVHELTHAVRRESHPDTNDLAEHVASEGLAYVCEDLATDMFLSDDEKLYHGDLIDPGPSSTYDGLKKSLAGDCSTELLEGQDTAVLDLWLGYETDQMPPGIVVGVTEVYRRLIEGNDFADMVRWPADQILDLKAA